MAVLTKTLLYLCTHFSVSKFKVTSHLSITCSKAKLRYTPPWPLAMSKDGKKRVRVLECVSASKGRRETVHMLKRKRDRQSQQEMEVSVFKRRYKCFCCTPALSKPAIAIITLHHRHTLCRSKLRNNNYLTSSPNCSNVHVHLLTRGRKAENKSKLKSDTRQICRQARFSATFRKVCIVKIVKPCLSTLWDWNQRDCIPLRKLWTCIPDVCITQVFTSCSSLPDGSIWNPQQCYS